MDSGCECDAMMRVMRDILSAAGHTEQPSTAAAVRAEYIRCHSTCGALKPPSAFSTAQRKRPYPACQACLQRQRAKRVRGMMPARGGRRP